MIVLIPAYEPRDTLVTLVTDLLAKDPQVRILIVDDGSSSVYAPVFERAAAAGAEVIGYRGNRGKGHALKFGFAYVRELYPGEDVVSADSDGQHLPTDILRIAERLRTESDALVLGGRAFSGDVPARSRFGNALSRTLFRIATGLSVRDTQTGLRGFPSALLEWLDTIPGERFEYELAMLLRARESGVRIVEVSIATVYLDGNSSSHFRPVVDSLRVMRPLALFGLSSLGSFVLDLVAVQLLILLTGSLVAAVFGARMISGTANFLINRHLVFGATEPRPRRQLLRYIILAIAIVVASYLGILALTGLGVALVPSKIIVDVVLYIVSYQMQRLVIFASTKRPAAGPEPRVVLESQAR
ncbi:bifunctional glycosyltransferase family 2/GtrA family protein [Salinibacterium sp. G-O1]|uniref:bifunctional glycosyltransferase family 2/GtrA family protein n=1 Tax=Salinibacterium sp. G-O1 TaxID=3046208 RepID=UPI0024B88A6D|nr:bifunctional glycosyltransferase family 2/GtrA family protein [Salinibacterium sp. G-O1]MDJ0335142.1 bifunctional glycosyltransferase family 2/GtrA family protein [Salinibacterium sp. G-O1]